MLNKHTVNTVTMISEPGSSKQVSRTESKALGRAGEGARVKGVARPTAICHTQLQASSIHLSG